MRSKLFHKVLAAGTVLAAATVLVVHPATLEGQQTGSVTGTVRVAKVPAAAAPAKVPRQTEVCGTSVEAGDVVTGRDGTLGGAVVWLEGVAKRAGVRPRDITLDQQRCRFLPRIQTATVGANVSLTSRDAVLHNVHGFLGERTIFNVAIPVAGMTIRKPLSEAGHVHFRCDAGHTWMAAHIQVFDHPYHMATATDGAFRIPDVPPGSYRLRSWHERLGEKTTPVTVAAGQAANLTVQY
ncbi:MAG: carboxypeptidase regulatory-like domain-containing protein [Deltaproteobacteria bacterium]|nr:carboxypeptidase regulatory-like domain-containing protein [Deltaproteobacteria bacterium]